MFYAGNAFSFYHYWFNCVHEGNNLIKHASEWKQEKTRHDCQKFLPGKPVDSKLGVGVEKCQDDHLESKSFEPRQRETIFGGRQTYFCDKSLMKSDSMASPHQGARRNQQSQPADRPNMLTGNKKKHARSGEQKKVRAQELRKAGPSLALDVSVPTSPENGTEEEEEKKGKPQQQQQP